MPSTTGSEIRTIGVMFTTKSANESPAALPIRIFGGSPMSVAAPPMLEAITWVSRKGIGEASSASAMRNVTGTMRITVVTLSRKAERNAVTRASKIRMRPGLALPHWALFMARYSKTPVLSRIATITIIPARRPMVFQSMNSVAASCWVTTPKETRTAAPSSAMTVRFTSSKAIRASTRAKSATAKTSCMRERIIQSHNDCARSARRIEGKGGREACTPAEPKDRGRDATRRERHPGYPGAGGPEDPARQQRPRRARCERGRQARGLRHRRAPDGIGPSPLHEDDGQPLLCPRRRRRVGPLPHRRRRQARPRGHDPPGLPGRPWPERARCRPQDGTRRRLERRHHGRRERSGYRQPPRSLRRHRRYRLERQAGGRGAC